MKIKRLRLVNLRPFEQVEFEFNTDITLLVGVNGVGKTTVLDAIRICLSKILPDVTASKSRPDAFSVEDIHGQEQSLTVQVFIELDRDYEYLVHKPRELNIPNKNGFVREQTLNTPEKETWIPELSDVAKKIRLSSTQPLGIFFSTRRALVSQAKASKGSAAGGQSAAFADALKERELRLVEFANWIKVQEDLASENPEVTRHLIALREAASKFLPGYSNLRAEVSPKPRLLIDKNGESRDVRMLSEGERGMLVLVLDIARRLSQANLDLKNPNQQGNAIVLIDELDLHIHPKWQRTIVKQLTHTFPKCQFIATTHSPQIIAAVEPEQVLMLTATGVVRPDRTLGMDSNWILRYLMETDDRPEDAAKVIKEVESLIKAGEFLKARTAITKAKSRGYDLPDWSVLEARMARLELLGA